MKAAIEYSRKSGVHALVLLGEPAFYRRFGFETTHLGNEYGAKKHFMAVELEPDCLAGVEAVCKYVGSFGELNDP
jgi:predicted N-acetyltransferase YhbS